MKINKYSILILLIIVTGSVLRLNNITSENFWLDEIRTIYLSNTHLLNTVELMQYEWQTPLYFLIINVWISFFSISEFSLRIPSVIFGVLSIIFTYKIVALLYNEKVGVLSAIFISISPIHIYFSQEARTYTFTVFLTLLSFYYFLKIFKSNKTTSRYFFI